MHVIQYSHRIYISLFLCLCAAFLFAPKVNAADGGYWSTTERRFISETERNYRTQRLIDQAVNKPANSTLSTASSAPTITKNASGGLSASTNQILKTMGQPSGFNSTSNYSLNAAKNALKTCARSPACATRTLGTGGLLYEGIRGWKDVYDLTLGDDGVPQRPPETLPSPKPNEPEIYVPPYDESKKTSSYSTGNVFLNHYLKNQYDSCPDLNGYTTVSCVDNNNSWTYRGCQTDVDNLKFVGYLPMNTCQWDLADKPATNRTPQPLSPEELDDLIDEGYEPQPSDYPIVISDNAPQTIELSTPAPAQLPSETRTETSSAGTTTTVIDRTINYTVTNNNTASPSISSSVTETSTTYDSNSNVLNTSTSTTSNPAVAPDPVADAPAIDFELPSFCSWASIVCDWIGWTKEPLGEDDPDLSQLITVFEPDEESFDLGIGSGSCPAPMMLNLGIINKTVEVKYDPFCSFLEMIRPFVLAAAYLFAAYLYIGVLRRG